MAEASRGVLIRSCNKRPDFTAFVQQQMSAVITRPGSANGWRFPWRWKEVCVCASEWVVCRFGRRLGIIDMLPVLEKGRVGCPRSPREISVN